MSGGQLDTIGDDREHDKRLAELVAVANELQIYARREVEHRQGNPLTGLSADGEHELARRVIEVGRQMEARAAERRGAVTTFGPRILLVLLSTNEAGLKEWWTPTMLATWCGLGDEPPALFVVALADLVRDDVIEQRRQGRPAYRINGEKGCRVGAGIVKRARAQSSAELDELIASWSSLDDPFVIESDRDA